jgi:hypothetical protein
VPSCSPTQVVFLGEKCRPIFHPRADSGGQEWVGPWLVASQEGLKLKAASPLPPPINSTPGPATKNDVPPRPF